MFEITIVFIIGTLVSFFPLLWLLKFLTTRESRKLEKRNVETTNDPANAIFLEMLKQEGFERAANAVEVAKHDLEKRFGAFTDATGYRQPDIPLLTHERLAECISLVESLFSRRTATHFRECIHALTTDYRNRSRHWAEHATAAVALLEGELRNGI